MTLPKTIKLAVAAVVASLTLSACNDAKIASQNLSKAAEQFEITRRVVFYNGITDRFALEMIGRCSIVEDRQGAKQLEVTCKVGPNAFKKHFLGLSDNMTYFVEQLEASDVSVYHYRLVFKPQTVLPDFDIRLDAGELPLPTINRQPDDDGTASAADDVNALKARLERVERAVAEREAAP